MTDHDLIVSPTVRPKYPLRPSRPQASSDLATTLSASRLALLVLAIGCGSLFFSHVNDAGFWLVKQYFGLTVGQTIKSWSVMETVISVVGFLFVLLLSLVV